MQSMGVPGVLLPLVIALELGGGLAVMFFVTCQWETPDSMRMASTSICETPS